MFDAAKHTLEDDLLVIIIDDNFDENTSYKSFHSKQNIINRVFGIEFLTNDQKRKIDEIIIFTYTLITL